MLIGQDSKTVHWYFKDLNALPSSQARMIWTSEAERLTARRVTHLAFIRCGSVAQLILPLVVVDNRFLIVPSEKIAAKVIEAGGAVKPMW